MSPTIDKSRYYEFVEACRRRSKMPTGLAPSVVAAAFSQLDERGGIDRAAPGYGEAAGFAQHVQLIDGGPLAAAADYTDEELRAIVLAPLDGWRLESAQCTSPAMAAAALAILNVRPGESLADLGCGLGEFMVAASRATRPASFTGVDTCYDAAKVAQMRSIVLGLGAAIEVGDAFRLHQTFDKVLCDCLLGQRRRPGEDGDPASEVVPDGVRVHSMEWAFCLKAASCVAEGGTGVGVVPMGALSNSMDAQVRAHMVRSGLVRAVVALPEGALSPHAGMACALVVLGHGNATVRLVDATDLGRREGLRLALSQSDAAELAQRLREASERAVDVSLGELEASRWNLAPNRHLRHVEVEGGVPLSSVVEVRRGVPLRLEERRSEAPTPYRFMVMKDVDKGEVSPNLPSLAELRGREERSLLQEGDVIVGKLRPYKAAVFHEREGERVLAGGNLYVLRPDTERVLPLYLRLFLESDLGAAQLEALTTGTSIPSLPVSAFDEVLVPLPPIAEQRRVVERCEELTAQAEEYERKARQVRDQIAGLLSERGQ